MYSENINRYKAYDNQEKKADSLLSPGHLSDSGEYVISS